MKANYSELDDAILNHITVKPNITPIYSGVLLKLAAELLDRDYEHGDDKEWRLIDRRMQALKKSGRIKYVRPNWTLVIDKE